MFARILMALDGSPTAEEALELARPLFRMKDARLDLLRVVPVVLRAGKPLDTAEVRRLVAEAGKYVEALAVRLRDDGVRARANVRFGLPVEEILKFAAAEGNDLVAMTTHGRTGVRRWVLGSVTEQVLRSTHVPLLVRKSFEETPAAGPIRKILAPLDGTAETTQALPYAVDVARACGAEIVLAGVVQEDGAEMERYLSEQAGELWDEGLRARIAMPRGEPAHQIKLLIDREAPDLVALATRGRVGVSRWVLGSVVERVLRSVSAPMLVHRIAPVEQP